MDSRTFNVLSLCTGGAGLELGLKLVVEQARTVCYVEREAYACAVLVARIQDETLDDAPVWTDIRNFGGRPWRGSVDCITAGYPCQPFSVAGRWRGAADPRNLWPHVARVVREVEPEWVFLENVAHHLRLGYRDVRRELEQASYRVTEGLFTAEEVGAPHRRKRLFILAHYGQGQPQEGMADTERTERLSIDGTRESGSARTDEHGQASGAVGECGAILADPLRSELEKRRSKQRDIRGQQPPAPGARDALFPPGPEDLDAWRTYLTGHPEAEPAVCRSHDGLAPRVDRLSLCGNGVVPLVAAYAFRTLYAEVMREESCESTSDPK